VPDTVEFKIKGKTGGILVLLNTKLVYENGFPKGATAVVMILLSINSQKKALR